MLMYTSCAWFFDDISGIEAVQALRYAARVIHLALRLGEDWEADFLKDLEKAESNVPRLKNGRVIYESLARLAVTTLARVAAHYAMVRTLDPDQTSPELFAYRAEPVDFKTFHEGPNALTVGRARVTSRMTGVSAMASFAALWLNEREVQCGVGLDLTDEEHGAMRQSLIEAFESQGLAEVVRRMDRLFTDEAKPPRRRLFGLTDLFLEARREAMTALAREAVAEMRTALLSTYGRHRAVMTLLRNSNVPVPQAFLAVARAVLDDEFDRALAVFLARGQSETLAQAIEEARRWGVAMDFEVRAAGLKRSLLDEYEQLPAEAEPLNAFTAKLRTAATLGLAVPRWELQNRVYERFCSIREERGEATAERGDTPENLLTAYQGLLAQLDFDPAMLACPAPAPGDEASAKDRP
jgi:hypothetical protein